MTDLENIFDLDNLRRAYRWILSNPDAAYKSYFRDSYDAFALASDTHLKWIRNEGLRDRYEPSHASKIYVPKPSGALRPITLLKVEDQIVYQAIVNLISDRLKKQTSHRYEKRVFAHLYAGKTSQFFYIQWQRSYRKFAQRLRASHARGYNHIANFDLTSFYDTIDHHVLVHFLMELKIDEDAIDYLMSCLRKWTSTTWSNGPQNIYHEHGIPQGPLSSGMLSETVLQHLDRAGEQGGRSTVYLRYVDDIKILAKTEQHLRAQLMKLDIASKEIGLFPQTAKINIRKISDPDEEIKSVSKPPEPSLVPSINQKSLTRRILELCRRGRIGTNDSTRFKYLLAQVKPSYKLSKRLMLVLRNHPEYAPQIASYISRYDRIPGALASDVKVFLSEHELYHSVLAHVLDACLERLPPPYEGDVGQAAADRLLRPKKGALPLQPSYKAALIGWALRSRKLSFAEFDGLVSGETDWWIKKRSLVALRADDFGVPSYESFLNTRMRENGSEVARICAARVVEGRHALVRPYKNVETSAKQTLKAAKIIRSVGAPTSRIDEIISYVLGRAKQAYDWKALFGKNHAHAERMMILLKRDKEANIEKFLVHLDSWCDLLFSEIYVRLKPGKKYPRYGAAISDPNVQRTLPITTGAFKALHSLRLESSVAHPRSEKTGKPTRRLKHRDFYKVRKELVAALDEIEQNIVP